METLKLLQSHQEKQILQKPQWIKNDSWCLNPIQPSTNWIAVAGALPPLSLTTPMPLLVSARTHLCACSSPPPPLLSCYELETPLTRVRDAWGHPVLHAASPLLWPNASPKPATLRTTGERTGCQGHCNKQSLPSEYFIKTASAYGNENEIYDKELKAGGDIWVRRVPSSTPFQALQPAVGRQISAAG